jgi:hypothetical protein
MSSFLKVFETVGVDLLKGAGTVASIIGAPAAGAAATAVGGPVAGAVAEALFNSIITAEKNHEAGASAAKKSAVLEGFAAFLPVVEALAAATGHPIVDRARFEAAVPVAIDATVQGLNAYAEMLASLHIPALPKAA